jgi:hypothetical protein
MQVSNTLIIVAAELCVLLVVASVLVTVYIRKLNTLIRRQQQKLAELLGKQGTRAQPTPSAGYDPVANYKHYLGELIAATTAQFTTIAPNHEISVIQPPESPLPQRTLALRYAFLRAEELSTTERFGTSEYWAIFHQALEPLLSSPQGINPHGHLE